MHRMAFGTSLLRRGSDCAWRSRPQLLHRCEQIFATAIISSESEPIAAAKYCTAFAVHVASCKELLGRYADSPGPQQLLCHRQASQRLKY
jgi:hypothetical protein